VNILYSFTKEGEEARIWEREIAAASTSAAQFIPFNHRAYLEPARYARAQLLDNLYFAREPGLMRLYQDFLAALDGASVDAVIVDTCPPYHPDFLRNVRVYKVLRIGDGPLSAYDRDFAYLHAYDHVLYHSRAYSPDLDMPQKLAYCGAKAFDFWPMWLFDAMFDPAESEERLFSRERDIDVVFVGALFPNKMPLIATVKKAFGARCRIFGLSSFKKNVYFNLRCGFPGWVRPIATRDYVPLYQRAKIGFNVHNRGKYTVGGFRLFELPGNGVMQISDGEEYLGDFFDVGREIESYSSADELVDKIRYYLAHEEKRKELATNGYRRVVRDHRLQTRLATACELISVRFAGAASGRALA
jgi:spore maturation protein CgeB